MRRSKLFSALLFTLLVSGPPLVADGSGGDPDDAFRRSVLLWARDVRRQGEDLPRREDLILFRDGLAVISRLRGDGGTEVSRATVPRQWLRDLNQLLVGERIHERDGRCNVEIVPPPEDLSGDRTWISWFGRDERARHLVVGYAPAGGGGPFPTPCPPAMDRLTAGVLDLVARIAALPPPTEDEPGRRLLLEVRSGFEEDPSCRDGFWNDDFLVFRDGLLLRRFVDHSGLLALARGTGSRAAQGQLNGTLVEEGVARQGGRCRIWFTLPFLVEGECLDFTWHSAATWHGRAGRHATLAGDDTVAAACTASQLTIRRAVVDYLENTLLLPSTLEVFARLPGF